ncbi:MAG: glycosyltransferase [Candidatus Binatia bacterium]
MLVADSPPEFARAVARLIDDPDLRRRIVASGRRRVETRYDWAVAAAPLIELHKRLMA